MASDLKETRARYSKVSRRMWNDEKFRSLSAPPPNGQTLWFRLLTGPELSNIPGVFSAWEAGLAQALRWPLEAFREAFREASSKGMAKADWEAGFVWVPNAPEYNKPESPNVIRSWGTAWEEMPECALKHEAYQSLKAFAEGWGEGFAKAFAETFGEALPESGAGAGAGAGADREAPLAPAARQPEQASLTLTVVPPPSQKPRRSFGAGSRTQARGETPVQVCWRVFRAAWAARYGEPYPTTRNDGKVASHIADEASRIAHDRAVETGEDVGPLLEELLAWWSKAYLELEENFHETRRHPLHGIENDLSQLRVPSRWRARRTSDVVRVAAPVAETNEPVQTAADRARLAREAAPRATTGTDDEAES